MKGKILGAGAISGEDGVRYYYDESELKNLKEGQKIEGCEVDFDVKDGKAIGVYITKGSGFNADFSNITSSVNINLDGINLPKFKTKHIFWDLNEVKQISMASLHSIKTWFLVGVIFNIIAVLFINPQDIAKNPELDVLWLFAISSIFVIWGSFCLGKTSGIYKPFQYQVVLLLLGIVCFFLLKGIISGYVEYIVGLGIGGNPPYIKIFLAVILLAIALYVGFLWFKSLSHITGERLFMVSFFVGIASFVFDIAQPVEISKAIARGKMETPITTYLYIFAYCGFIGFFSWATLRFREIKQSL